MSLYAVQPPDRTRNLALDYLARMRSGSGFHTRGRLACGDATAYLAVPHPVFNLSVDDMRVERPLDGARMTGWRFLVVSKREPLATVELRARYLADKATFGRVTDGPMAVAVAAGLKRAEGSRAIQDGDYAVGMVRIPSLQLAVLWLRDAQGRGERDMLVPLAAGKHAVHASQLLSPSAFFVGAWQRAEKVYRWTGLTD